MTEQEESTAGWYETLDEAAKAALDEAEEIDQIREVVFEGRKRNPIHEFRAKLKPPRD
jgi:hypothetical protein